MFALPTKILTQSWIQKGIREVELPPEDSRIIIKRNIQVETVEKGQEFQVENHGFIDKGTS